MPCLLLKKRSIWTPGLPLLTPISRSLTTTSTRTLWPPIASARLSNWPTARRCAIACISPRFTTTSAQAILNQAFAHKLDDASMHAGLYALAFLRGDSPGMAREMTWSVGKPGGEDAMLALQADTEAYFGHLKKARDLSRRAVQAAQNAQLTEPAAIWQGTAAIREAIYGNLEEARNGAEKALEIAPKSRDTQILATLALTRAGEARRAQT